MIAAVVVTYCVYGTLRNGRVEWDCDKERGSEERATESLSGLDKDRTGSKRTQDGTTILLEFACDWDRIALRDLA